MINLTIKAFDGQSYELTSRSGKPKSSAAQLYRNDPYLTQRFVARLPIEPRVWLQILQRSSHSPIAYSSNHPAEIHQAVAKSIMRGDLKLYKLPRLDAVRSIRGKQDMGLCIIQGPHPHSASNQNPVSLNSPQAARELLNELGIEPQTLLAYLEHQKLYTSDSKGSSLDKVLNQLATGELLAYKIPMPPMAPPAKKMEMVEATGPAYEPVPMGPETTSSSAPTSQPAPATAKPEPVPEPAPTTDVPGKNPAGETAPSTSTTCTGGEPISLVTGEELLELQDFEFGGLIRQTWTRTYRSSNRRNLGLGVGWTHSLCESLRVKKQQVYLQDAEGRSIVFALPAIGDDTSNRSEKLRLFRLQDDTLFITSTAPGAQLAREFVRTPGAQTFFLVALHDALGNSLELIREQGKLTRITSSDLSWEFSYTPDGNIASIQQQNNQGEARPLVSYDYDDQGDLVKATDTTGQSESYAYQQHQIRKRTLKTGYSFYFEWDGLEPQARCLRNWGDSINGQATYDYRFEWDKANRRSISTDTRGGKQIYEFNEQGLPIYHRDPEGGETRTQYDEFGNITRIIDPLGATTLYTYDDQQRLLSVTDKLGQTSYLVRDDWGNVIANRDPAGNSWQRQYDEQGLITSQTNPLGETTHYQYNGLGLVNAISDPLNRTWNFIWDNQGKLVARKDPQGNQTRYSYSSWGELVKITWPDNQISEYRYDNQGKCTAIKHPDGKVEQFAYNELGLLSGQKDSAGRTTRYEYNGLSQVVKRINPDGSCLHYHYDGERNLIGLTNENGEQYRLDYDLNERLVQEVGFDGRVQRYNYNAAGHLQSAQDFARNGRDLINQIDFVRRADGRVTQQIDSLSGSMLNQFDYDANGRITLAKNAARELRWSYDALGRVIEDWQGQQAIRHSYNAASERTRTQLPNGELINYSYNSNGQFAGLAFNQKSVVAIAHDAMGRELKRLLGNQLETESRYDPQGRLIAQRTGKRNQDNQFAPISQRRFHYNDFGQLTQIDDKLRGSTRYHYDALDRLTQVDGPNPETFVHDPAGNILGTQDQDLSQAPAQTHGNRLAFYGDNHYSYDERGNRTLVARGKQQRLQQRFSYNSLNQLESVEYQGQVTCYEYDALGRRIRKSNAQGSTEFLWLDNTLLSETTQIANQESTQTAKIYLFEPGTHKPLAIAQNDELYHYHLDHLGTPQEITNTQGQIAWSANYKAYGNLALVQHNEIENNLRFQGQYFDEETGLHYNRFRYYDPECGRFISQDPIGLLGGVNNYQYVPNPTGWVDPLGLSCKEPKPYSPNSRPDFYVGPAGPATTMPSTAYRYDRYLNDDGTLNEWGEKIMQTSEGRVTYFGFEKYETGTQAADAFQIKTKRHINPLDPEDRSWSDSRLRSEFDTLQLYDSNGAPTARVPNACGDRPGAPPEPFTSAYPEFGKGGAQQLHADGKTIKYNKTDILPED